MKVVLDTNVIVSGLLWKGSTKVLFDLIEKGEVTICLTPKIIGEVKKGFKLFENKATVRPGRLKH